MPKKLFHFLTLIGRLLLSHQKPPPVRRTESISLVALGLTFVCVLRTLSLLFSGPLNRETAALGNEARECSLTSPCRIACNVSSPTSFFNNFNIGPVLPFLV